MKGPLGALRRILVLVLGVVLCLTGCGGSAPVEQELFAMDTVMRLRLWGPEAQQACVELQKLLQTLEAQYSVTRAGSLLDQLNGGQTVELEPDQAALLAQTIALSRRTGGALDPTLYPVTLLWGFTTGSYRVPDEAEIRQALSRTGLDKLQLTDRSAALAPGAKLDLGAVAKGWAGGQAVNLLEGLNGVECALLALGGNVQTYGAKPDGRPWEIGIQDPFGSGTAGILQLEGTWAVVTSGGYQRYFESDGHRYCHILDPATGAPADSGLASVTIVARDGLLADGLSTALYVMGLEQGEAFWRDAGDFEVVWITDAGAVYATQGLASALTDCTYEVVRP